jgi:DNA-binding protein H-NS
MQDYKQIDIEIANRNEAIERYKEEREALLAERAKIAEAELAEAVAKVNALGGYATVEPPKKTATRAPSTGPKKYRDPASGAEWSGQGSKPKWFSIQDEEQFLNPTWLGSKAGKKYKATSTIQSPGASTVLPEANQSIDSVVGLNALPLTTQVA